MEVTKIKMNMDGTIRAKVLQYKSDGNTLTEKWETLAKLVDGVYYAKDRDNWDNVRYAFIFEDNGIFWYSLRAATENQFNNPKERERIINLRKNFRAYVKETAQNNGFIRSLEIEVFKRLGEDTAPLYMSREAYLKNREEEERKRAEEAERRERERKEAEERRKAELLADGKEKLMNHERIAVEQIELIAESVGYKINIRTIGFMREKVTEAVLREDDTVTIWGRKLTSRNIDGTAKVMRELYDRLKTQVEEEARQAATSTETPQISTEATETVNVSAEGEKAAETKETPRCECPNYADYAFERGRSIENTDFDPHSGVLCMIHFDPSDEKYVCGCLWQINSDKPNYTEHRRFKTLKGAQNYGTKRMGMKLEYQTLTVNCSVTPSEPPQSPKTPQTAECTAEIPKPRETARKRQNRGISNTRTTRRDALRDTLRPVTYVPRECSTIDAAYW